jgi:hypothetical protein
MAFNINRRQFLVGVVALPIATSEILANNPSSEGILAYCTLPDGRDVSAKIWISKEHAEDIRSWLIKDLENTMRIHMYGAAK